MIAANPVTVRPAGEWNQMKIRIKDGHVENWLNGYKVVEYTMFDSNWREMIAIIGIAITVFRKVS